MKQVEGILSLIVILAIGVAVLYVCGFATYFLMGTTAPTLVHQILAGIPGMFLIFGVPLCILVAAIIALSILSAIVEKIAKAIN